MEHVEILALVPVEVDHGLIALIPHLAAEVPLDVRQGSGIHIPGPGGVGGNFPVQHNGHIQLGIPQNFQHELDFLVGFLDAQCLREEVGTDPQAGFLGVFQIGFGVLVLHQLAAFIAPVAQADDGKIDAGLLYPLPVDVTLKGGNVHAGVAFYILQQQVIVAVVLEVKPVIGVPVRRNGGVFRLCFRNGRLQIGFQRRPGDIFSVLLVQQCLRVLFRQRFVWEIVPAHQQDRAQQQGRQSCDDSQNPFRAKAGPFSGGVRRKLRQTGIQVFGLFQLFRNLQRFHGTCPPFVRNFDLVYHIFLRSPSGKFS